MEETCLICNNRFKSLMFHLKKHKINKNQYEEKFQIKIKHSWNDGLTKQTSDSLKKMGLNRTGSNNPVHRIKNKEQWKQNCSKAFKKLHIFRQGKSLEEIYGTDKAQKIKQNQSEAAIRSSLTSTTRGHHVPHSEETKNKIRIKTALQISRQEIKTITKNQLLLFENLKMKIPELEIEYRVLYYSLDLAIPSKKIAIELDGDFWHAHWKDNSNLYPIQLKNMKNDLMKQKYLIENGWKIIRIWDSECQKIEEIVKLIEEHIESGKNRLFGQN